MWKKKQWKRKPRRSGRKIVNVNRSLQPVSQRYICSLKYTTTIALSSLANVHRFRLNSLFDTDLTGVGHQPYGYDQLATLYNRYRVISTSYSIIGYNSVPIRLIALPGNESVSPADPSNAMENPRAKWVVQLPGGNTKTLKGRCYMPSIVGRSKQQYMADDRYQAETTTNPLESVVLNVFHGNLTDLTYPTDNTNVVITLLYKVEFFDVKNQSQS